MFDSVSEFVIHAMCGRVWLDVHFHKNNEPKIIRLSLGIPANYLTSFDQVIISKNFSVSGTFDVPWDQVLL